MRNLIKDLKKSSLFENKSNEELENLINSINYKIIKLKKKRDSF